MNLSIKNKNIVISGGTSGVGRELVLACTREGANVIFGGRNEIAAKDILKEVEGNLGKASFIYTNLSDVSDCKRLFTEAINKFKKIDGFVNYAGVTPVSPLDSCSEATFDNVMGVNFKAAFFCCQEAIKNMRKNGGGSIIIVGSPHAWSGDKDRAAYACSKGALLTLMNHIAHNYGCEKIRCNYLVMGWTLTEGEINLRKSQYANVDSYFEEAAELIPMKRLCLPKDYVEQIVYLLSDSSAMQTGSVIQMSAGYFL